MSELKVPIQLNRGNSLPTDLKEGEPFLILGSMTLSIKGASDTAVNIEGYSQFTHNIINKNGLFSFNDESIGCEIGGFTIMKSESKYNFKPTFASNNITLSNFAIDGLKKTILTSDMYGSALPPSGVKGQLFFKLT